LLTDAFRSRQTFTDE